MSASVFCLPDLGEGLIEATVVSWLVKAGDHVSEGQPVVEVETTKSSAEIPASFTGTITELHAAEGETVAVGQALFSYEDEHAESSSPGIVGTVPQGRPRTARRVHLRPPADDD